VTTHITKTWFDGEKVVTQEIPESEVYKQAPRCAVIVEVFAKDWRLDYMSLPVGKHRLYTQEYVYTTPQPCPTCEALARTVMMDQTAHDTQRQPLTDEQIDAVCAPLGFAQLSPREVARAIEAAHGITGEKT
jgi:hypothetical protein